MLSDAGRAASAVDLDREGPSFPATGPSPGDGPARRDPTHPGFAALLAPPEGVRRDAGEGFPGRCVLRGPASRSDARFEPGEGRGFPAAFSGEGQGVSMLLEVFQRLSRSSFRGDTPEVPLGGPDMLRGRGGPFPPLPSCLLGNSVRRVWERDGRARSCPPVPVPPRDRGRPFTRLPRRVSRSPRLPFFPPPRARPLPQTESQNRAGLQDAIPPL